MMFSGANGPHKYDKSDVSMCFLGSTALGMPLRCRSPSFCRPPACVAGECEDLAKSEPWQDLGPEAISWMFWPFSRLYLLYFAIQAIHFTTRLPRLLLSDLFLEPWGSRT